MWTTGYTLAELDAAQERFNLRFPPDLLDLLSDRRPVAGWDWCTDDEGIRRAMSWPLDGLIFDVEQNDLWWAEWGERPPSAHERAEIVTGIVGAAPKLIPLVGHRYIPELPHERGNPVFSVMQSDVICYGADLAEYFANEFDGANKVGPAKYVPFWSDLVDRNI